MEVEPKTPTASGPADWFTGSVWGDVVASPRPPASRVGAGLVRFAPGARTAWHVHPLGQVLHITQGTAIVENRDGQTVIAHPGQTVYTAPDKWHWHGAAQHEFMEHLALTEGLPPDGGATVAWGEQVGDDEYDRAQQPTDDGSQR